MSKISIEGNASGTGTFTIASPNSNSNFTLHIPSASGTIDRLNRAGNVLQVVSTAKTDTFSTSSTSYTDITGLSVSITPTSASSKILVFVQFGQLAINGTNKNALRLMRDSTAINVGAASGSRTPATISYNSFGVDDGYPANVVFLDSPATTSATTYKMQTLALIGDTMFVNRNSTDTDSSTFFRGTATITVMEIAG